jgi:hypothetical protein
MWLSFSDTRHLCARGIAAAVGMSVCYRGELRQEPLVARL